MKIKNPSRLRWVINFLVIITSPIWVLPCVLRSLLIDEFGSLSEVEFPWE